MKDFARRLKRCLITEFNSDNAKTRPKTLIIETLIINSEFRRLTAAAASGRDVRVF